MLYTLDGKLARGINKQLYRGNQAREEGHWQGMNEIMLGYG
jgi:hypothetical protein